MYEFIGIDPGHRNNGVVTLSRGGRGWRCSWWTIKCKLPRPIEDVPAMICELVNREFRGEQGIFVIEKPPPRISKKKYQLGPSLSAGIWMGALANMGHRFVLVPSSEWQEFMFGVGKKRGGKSTKWWAQFRCKSYGADLPNEHTRDAYLLGRWAEQAARNPLMDSDAAKMVRKLLA